MNKLIIATALAALAAPAYAQTSNSNMMSTQPSNMQASPTSNKQAQTNQEFVNKSAMTNMFEVKSGQIAENKSQNPKVDSFAKMIVQDHQQAEHKLESVAKNIQGVQVPNKLDQKHQQMIDQLQSASGAKFLKTFKQQEVKGHKQAINALQRYEKNGNNAQLKQWAQQTLPTLKHHLQVAQTLPTSTSAPTTGSASSSAPASK